MLPVLPLLFTLASTVAPAQEDPAKDLRAKDPALRLAALETLDAEGHDKLEKLLLGALKDKDWEVRERAIILLGRHGTPRMALDKLIGQALEAPVRRMRWAAADSAAALDGVAAAEDLAKKLKGKTATRAAQALARIAIAKEDLGDLDGAKLQRLVAGKEASVREAATYALLAVEPTSEALVVALSSPDVVVRCAALEALAQRPQPASTATLLEHLSSDDLRDVERRRVLTALETVLGLSGSELEVAVEAARSVWQADTLPAAYLALVARSAKRVGQDQAIFGDDGARAVYETILAGDDVAGRTAAAAALGACERAEALPRLVRLSREDEAWRVRLIAMRTALNHFPLERPKEGSETAQAPDGETDEADPQDLETLAGRVAWLSERLASDEEGLVREEAAVRLAIPDSDAPVDALVAALEDSDWRVAACAAVSLGHTRTRRALDALIAQATATDWTLRGAAIVGIGHTILDGMVEPLLAALEDEEPAVAYSALEGLQRVTGQYEMGPEAADWRSWWAEHGEKIRLRDPRKDEERRKKYGYHRPESEIYRGLDVIVLVSRGDHIQNIFDRREIAYRTTAAAQITECGLHPESVFVSNCTGEIEVDDVERLEWFVRVGGSVFGSCWALSQTIERIYPGVVRKLATVNEVLDDVRAHILEDPEKNPFLRGAFSHDVHPIYHLEGAHLIEVLFPERCQVLLDSPEASERHGGGNLAVWFDAGHGVILDSVNHFDLQGLEVARGLKTPEDRQAYAVDHMGLTYAEWRKVKGDKFWKNNVKASREVFDESAFRFVTNFVRAKRLGDELGDAARED